MTVARDEAVGRPALAGTDFTFLPGDPPGRDISPPSGWAPNRAKSWPTTDGRSGPAGDDRAGTARGHVGPAPARPRRPPPGDDRAGAAARRRSVANYHGHGAHLGERDDRRSRPRRPGRLHPAVSPGGLDAGAPARWARRTVSSSDVWPKPCRPWPTPSLKNVSSPLRLHSPTFLITAAWTHWPTPCRGRRRR